MSNGALFLLILFRSFCRSKKGSDNQIKLPIFRWPFVAGTGVITKKELKHFYTAFLDVGKQGDRMLEETTNKAFSALTSVRVLTVEKSGGPTLVGHALSVQKASKISPWNTACICFARKGVIYELVIGSWSFQDGEVKLNYHIFKLSFLNFLLGRQPNGPGQFIFGTVHPRVPTCMFPIDYSAMNATEEDLEPFW